MFCFFFSYCKRKKLYRINFRLEVLVLYKETSCYRCWIFLGRICDPFIWEGVAKNFWDRMELCFSLNFFYKKIKFFNCLEQVWFFSQQGQIFWISPKSVCLVSLIKQRGFKIFFGLPSLVVWSCVDFKRGVPYCFSKIFNLISFFENYSR